jgi:hypothetical protein
MNDAKVSTRRLRKQENNNFNEYVIKTTLTDALCTNKHTSNQIINLIKIRVEATSKGLQRLSFAMNLFVKDCMNATRNPLNIVLPNFLSDKDNTFFRQMMVGIDNARKINPIVDLFYQKRQHLLPLIQNRYSADRNIICRASEQYAINYRTYLATSFNKKQNTFLKKWCERHDLVNDSQIIKRKINGWSCWSAYVPNQVTSKLIDFQRRLLNLTNNDFISDCWLKQNSEKILVYFNVLSNYLVKHGFAGIASAPLCKMKATFIHIDTDVFHGILKELKLTSYNILSFRDNVETEWSKILNTNKYLTRNQREICRFTNTIQSDGYSICIHYRRPKIEINNIHDNYHYEYNQQDRIIGQDPGRVNMFTGVEKLEDGTWKEYSLSRKTYYEDSKINVCSKKTNKWNLAIKDELDQLSKCNTRDSIEQFINYINIVNQNYDTFWTEYLNDKWSKQRLKLYSGKKRTLDKFFNTLKDDTGRRIVIAYGDAAVSYTHLTLPTM